MTFNPDKPDTSLFVPHRGWWRAMADWVRGFIYGMTYFEMERELRKQRADLEHLFVLISFGDLLGVPILPLPIPCGGCPTLCRC